MPGILTVDFVNSQKTFFTTDGGVGTYFTNNSNSTLDKGTVVALNPPSWFAVTKASTSNLNYLYGITATQCNNNTQTRVITSGVAIVKYTGTQPSVGDKVRLSSTESGKCEKTTLSDNTSGVLGICLQPAGSDIWVALDIIK